MPDELTDDSDLPVIRPDREVRPEEVPELVDAIVAALRRWIYFRREEEYLTVALWVIHTYTVETAYSTPYLRFDSVLPESGKSVTLKVLSLLAHQAELVVNPTAPNVFRSLSLVGEHAMLLEEVDTIFTGGANKDTSDLRSVLNEGYKRGAKVRRLKLIKGEWIQEAFNIFFPKAFAGLGNPLPATLNSRSIHIRMHRCPRAVPLDKFRPRKAAESTAELRGWLQAWAEVAVERLRDAEPDVPDELGYREAEYWEPLFAIADLGGGIFGAQVRDAAIELRPKDDTDEIPREVLLLKYTREAFDQAETDRLHSMTIAKVILTRDDDDNPFLSRWGRWAEVEYSDSRKKSIGKDMAKLLKSVGVPPPEKSLWVDGVNRPGYYRSSFEEAWKEYLQ
jgi:hypothetical protein